MGNNIETQISLLVAKLNDIRQSYIECATVAKKMGEEYSEISKSIGGRIGRYKIGELDISISGTATDEEFALAVSKIKKSTKALDAMNSCKTVIADLLVARDSLKSKQEKMKEGYNGRTTAEKRIIGNKISIINTGISIIERRINIILQLFIERRNQILKSITGMSEMIALDLKNHSANDVVSCICSSKTLRICEELCNAEMEMTTSKNIAEEII